MHIRLKDGSKPKFQLHQGFFTPKLNGIIIRA
jgi:hypothetical protein